MLAGTSPFLAENSVVWLRDLLSYFLIMRHFCRINILRPQILFIPMALLATAACSRDERISDSVTVDYGMAEATIDWLEYVKSGESDDAIRELFFQNVAPTEGCQAIIRHWARFMEWNEEIFYDYILEALGRIETDTPLQNEDGTPTPLGRRRALWTGALENTRRLRENLAALREADLKESSLRLARHYLPKGADVTNSFHVVLFGGSSAFSVGEVNGYDLLQMPLMDDGILNLEQIRLTFAHEMHHSGFSNAATEGMGEVENEDNIILAGILAAEGMATWLINRPLDHLEDYRTGSNTTNRLVAQDWDRLLPQLPDIYERGGTDIRLNLEGNLDMSELQEYWLSGYQGPAYILGSDMVATIEEYLGLKAVRSIAKDYRELLELYNRAARRANRRGAAKYLFDEALAVDVALYR